MPAVVWWPGQIAAGSYSNALVSTPDIFATVLDIAGVTLPDDRVYDGQNITAVLLDGGPSPHDVLFFYRMSTLYAVRYYAFKLHYFTKSGYGPDKARWHDPPLVFNVEMDPSEAYRLNPKDSKTIQIIDEINAAVAIHNQTMWFGADQLNGRNTEYAVCCDMSTKCYCG